MNNRKLFYIERIKNMLSKSRVYINKCLITGKPACGYVGGWIGKQNLGDEALKVAAKRLFYNYDLIQFGGSRTEMAICQQFPFFKDGMLAGGTLINRMDEWLTLARMYLSITKNLFIFGTGVANPVFWSGRSDWINRMEEWKEVLEKCHYVGVRGPLSEEMLQNAGLRNVEVIGDPVLVFAKRSVNYSYVPKTIGLNIGQDNGRHWGNEEDILNKYVKIAKLAKEKKWKVKWFVVHPKDFPITEKAAILSNTDREINEIYDDAEKYIETVRPLSTFVGMKLHATVLATCAIVPSIMLEYRPKCLDYMKSIGQDKYTFRTDQFNADSIWEIVRSWNERRGDVAENLFESIKCLSEKQQEKAKYLMDRRLKISG